MLAPPPFLLFPPASQETRWGAAEQFASCCCCCWAAAGCSTLIAALSEVPEVTDRWLTVVSTLLLRRPLEAPGGGGALRADDDVLFGVLVTSKGSTGRCGVISGAELEKGQHLKMNLQFFMFTCFHFSMETISLSCSISVLCA